MFQAGHSGCRVRRRCRLLSVSKAVALHRRGLRDGIHLLDGITEMGDGTVASQIELKSAFAFRDCWPEAETHENQ